MNRRETLQAAAAIIVGTFASRRSAAAGSTLLQVQAMVDRAVAFFEAYGPQATIKAVNDATEFRDGELYIFIIDPDGLSAANAGDRSNLGRDVRLIQDVDGKFYGREMLERARPEGAWVEYKRLNPENGRIQLKKTWVRKIDGYIIGSGVYLSE